MDVFDLVAKLMLDSSPYEEGLKNARTTAKGAGSMIGKGLRTIGKVAGAALAAATTAVVGFGVSAVKTGAEFDSAMSQVAATMGKTVDEIQDLRDFALDMGSKTAFSATQSAEALNYMALAGYDADTSMAMLPNVLNLAAAGNMELAKASDMVTDAQTALGLGIEDTTKMVDQMAATASKSNTSVDQLGEAFLTVGATARNLKGGTVELSTVLGVLADNGIKGAEGGTHLRNAILSLQTPTKDGAAALEKLGMTYEDMYDSSGNMRSLPEIFQQMSTAMEGMNQQSKDAIISGLFNKTDLASINALLGTSAERWDELGAAIEDSTGAAEKMAATQLDNLAGDITLFKSALEGAKIAISDGLTPSLRKFVQFGTQGLTKITDAFKEGGIDAAVDAFGEIVTEGIGKITNALPKVLNAGKKILGAVGKGIIQNLPQLASAAVGIMAQLAIGIAEAIPEIINALPEIFAAIKQAFIDNAPALKEAGIKLLIAIAQGIASGLQWIGEQMMQLGSSIQNWLAEAWEGVKAAAAEKWAQIAEAISSAVENIREKFAEWVSTAASKVEEFKEAIHSGIQGLLSSIGTWIQENLVEPAKEKIQEFTNIGQQIVENIKSGLTEGWASVKNFFTGKWSELVGGDSGTEEVQAQVDEVSRIFMSGTEEAADAGTQTVGEYVGSISDGEGDAGSAGDGVGSATVKGMNKEGEAYTQGADNVRAYNRGVQSVPVATIGGGGTSHAIGNDYVPYNNYPALLHRGEAVLTAREADEWRRGQSGGGDGGFTLIQNIETVPQTPVELAAASAAFLEQARWAV